MAELERSLLDWPARLWDALIRCKGVGSGWAPVPFGWLLDFPDSSSAQRKVGVAGIPSPGPGFLPRVIPQLMACQEKLSLSASMVGQLEWGSRRWKPAGRPCIKPEPSVPPEEGLGPSFPFSELHLHREG